MYKKLIILLTSTAFCGLVSMLINFYQWHVKTRNTANDKERRRLYNEVKYYRTKFLNDENEIDHLKEKIRKLKAAQFTTVKERSDIYG